jgi:hypothetical protein
VRAGQPHCPDDQQRGDEHADQTRPHLALQQHHDREQQCEHRDDDHRRPRLDRVVVAPDPDVEEGQRVEAEHQQTGDGDRGEHRIHRRATVLRPVHVLQVQDQGELVEHQRRADAEADCGDREFDHSPVHGKRHHGDAGDHHEDHADHHVVDVQPAARRDVAWLPPLARRVAACMPSDVPDDRARHEERQDERHQAAKQWNAITRDEVELDREVHDRKLTPTCTHRRAVGPRRAGAGGATKDGTTPTDTL